jgi:TldD protein
VIAGEPVNEAPLIEPGLAERVLERALERGGDFAEVFCEQRSGFSLSIDESRVERAQRGSERGAGVRVVSGETTYFVHVDGLAEPDLLRAAEAAAAALSGGRTEARPLAAAEAPALQEIEVPPEEVPAERKAELLREVDERARAAGGEVAQVQASYS